MSMEASGDQMQVRASRPTWHRRGRWPGRAARHFWHGSGDVAGRPMPKNKTARRTTTFICLEVTGLLIEVGGVDTLHTFRSSRRSPLSKLTM